VYPKRQLLLSVLAALVLLLCACGNPRHAAQPRNAPENEITNDDARPQAPQRVRVVPARQNGERFRTVRKLNIVEPTDQGTLVIESDEVTLTTVLRVDESGRMLAVRRSYESAVTRVGEHRRRLDETRGELDGCTLELTQQMGGVDVRVLAGDVRVGRQQFVIEGFDTALLPFDPVRVGDNWIIEGGALSGLNRIIESMDFTIDRNRMQCVVREISDRRVVIGLDWRISGEYGNRPAIMHFQGELQFDRDSKLVSDFELGGGRTGATDATRQVSIKVTRRPVDGWLDLQR
jgi:hypothetical protein